MPHHRLLIAAVVVAILIPVAAWLAMHYISWSLAVVTAFGGGMLGAGIGVAAALDEINERLRETKR